MKMLQIMKFFLFLTLVQSLIGCTKDNTPSPPSTDDILVWKTDMTDKMISPLNSAPLIYKETVIIGKLREDGYQVTGYVLKDGKVLWTTTLPNSSNFNPIDTETCTVYNDVVIFSHRHRTYVLNAKNGELIWHKEKEKVRGGFCLIDNYIYRTEFAKRSYSTLFRYHLETGEEEELIKLKQGSNEPGGDFSPIICLPVQWFNKDGDEVLIMQNASYNFDRIGPDGMYGHSKMDVFAYNLTADSILWYRYELDGFSSMARPAIDGDKVYFYGDHHGYCIDAETGKTNWKFFIGDGPEDDFNTANILLVDNFLVVKPDNEHMHVVQKEDGKLVWTNKETEAMPGMITHRNDTLWFASARIYGIDLYTGKKVVEWDDGRWGDWIFPVSPHPTLPYIYNTDGNYVYCLDPRNM